MTKEQAEIDLKNAKEELARIDEQFNQQRRICSDKEQDMSLEQANYDIGIAQLHAVKPGSKEAESLIKDIKTSVVNRSAMKLALACANEELRDTRDRWRNANYEVSMAQAAFDAVSADVAQVSHIGQESTPSSDVTSEGSTNGQSAASNGATTSSQEASGQPASSDVSSSGGQA